MLLFVSFFYFFLSFQFALSPLPGIDMAIARIAALAISLFWVMRGLAKRSLWISTGLQTPLLLTFLFLNLFSLTWANLPEWGLRKFLFLFSFFPLFFVITDILRKPSAVFTLTRAIVYGASAAGIIGIAQFCLQALFSLNTILTFWTHHILPIFLGHTFAQTVAHYPSLLVNVGGHTLLRANGLFPDPHMFSFFTGMAFPLALGLAATRTQQKNRFLILALVLLLADCLTFSRGGYLGLLAGGFAFILLRARKGASFSCKWPVILSLPLLCLSLLFAQPFWERFASSFRLEEGSNQGRLAMWKEASQIITDHPFGGVGLGNYSLVIKPSAHYREPIYAHSLYLDIAAETGLPALLVFLLLLLIAAVSLYRIAQTEDFFLYPLLSLIIFSVHSLVETPLYSVHVLPLFIALLAMSTYRASKNSPLDSSSIKKNPSSLGALFL